VALPLTFVTENTDGIISHHAADSSAGPPDHSGELTVGEHSTFSTSTALKAEMLEIKELSTAGFGKHLVSIRLRMRSFGATEERLTLTK